MRADSLENGYAEGVVESLSLFAELLGYQPAPKAFRIRHHEILGAVTEKEDGEILYGPMVVFRLVNNSLVMLEEKISSFDKAKMALFQKVARGEEKPSIEGKEVFRYLKETV